MSKVTSSSGVPGVISETPESAQPQGVGSGALPPAVPRPVEFDQKYGPSTRLFGIASILTRAIPELAGTIDLKEVQDKVMGFGLTDVEAIRLIDKCATNGIGTQFSEILACVADRLPEETISL